MTCAACYFFLRFVFCVPLHRNVDSLKVLKKHVMKHCQFQQHRNGKKTLAWRYIEPMKRMEEKVEITPDQMKKIDK